MNPLGGLWCFWLDEKIVVQDSMQCSIVSAKRSLLQRWKRIAWDEEPLLPCRLPERRFLASRQKSKSHADEEPEYGATEMPVEGSELHRCEGLTRMSSATAGGSERGLPWKRFHNVTGGLGAASG